MIKLSNVIFNYQSMPMMFDLHIQAQEKIAIIGESGAGKSTLLNLIAGFEYADSGEIWLNGENHTKTAPFEHPVSMLFQENNLFTHLSVEENIALGLKPNLVLNTEEKALEPFSALDPKLRIEMQDLMDQLCEEKKLTMLLVTHQPKEIERHIDRVIEIHQGKVI